MKNYLLFILFSLSIYSSKAQHFAISLPELNTFYAGIENPITIIAANCPDKQLVVKTNKGEIHGNDSKYIYRSDEPGEVTITLYKKTKKGLKKIGASIFRIKFIPGPSAWVGPSAGGNIHKTTLRYQQYLRAEVDNDFLYDVHFTIDSFTVSIIRMDSCIHQKIFNTGNKFNDRITAAFQALEKDDIVIFDKIYATGPARQILLSPLILTITD